MSKKFQGVVVPAVCPLHSDKSIDVSSVQRIMSVFSDFDISPLLLGTTGESTSLSEKESLMLISAASGVKRENQFIYTGLSGNCEEDLILRAKKYAEAGADVLVATLPFYYPLSDDEMYGFFDRLASSLSLPLMIYNIKATTGMSIPVDIIKKLMNHENIAGLKDSERDEDRLQTCINLSKTKKGFSYFCGWGAMGGQSLQWGADGIVPSTGNLVPEMYAALYKASLTGDFALMNQWQSFTDEVAVFYQKSRSLGQSLAALKCLMHSRGFCDIWMKNPLKEVPVSERQGLVDSFNKWFENFKFQ
ncbi:MAG: dihydrodipicolinate synthase family protein [Cyclobacteriaceae bacterium]|nr:dihydrodipicolinate synthase family protein [Cyclobacteriaceae bacterium]